MLEVRTTAVFDEWLDSLDNAVRARLSSRLDKLARGLWGDRKTVGASVIELREHFGSGYRMYVVERGQTIVVVLAGGDKSTQSADIQRAIELAKNL